MASDKYRHLVNPFNSTDHTYPTSHCKKSTKKKQSAEKHGLNIRPPDNTGTALHENLLLNIVTCDASINTILFY